MFTVHLKNLRTLASEVRGHELVARDSRTAKFADEENEISASAEHAVKKSIPWILKATRPTGEGMLAAVKRWMSIQFAR